MTKEAVKSNPTARAPLKLSREMKLVLALLLLVALLGAWFVWTGSRGADDLTQKPPATPAGDPPADSAGASAADPAATPDETGSADGVAVSVQPGGQVEVPTIPAFGTLEGEAAAGPATEALPTPGGINPDTALAALPGVNPFRPLALDSDPEAPAETPAAPVAEAPVSTPTASLDLSPSGLSGDTASVSPDSGALGLAPLPGTSDPSDPVPLETPRVTGAFPLPTLPGADVPAPTVLTVTRPAAQVPTAQPPVVRVPAVRPATPARPPVAGVSVPRQNIDLSGALARPAARPVITATGTAAAPALTALPTPGTPQPITQLELGAAADATPTPANALEALIQSRDLGLNAAVLGPVNTAILHSKDGFLVVSVGQTLPDSGVLVQGVSADSVTLALGSDTTTLQLDDSANDPANDPAKGEP